MDKNKKLCKIKKYENLREIMDNWLKFIVSLIIFF